MRASAKMKEVVRFILFIGYNPFLLEVAHGENEQA
jgi:hypothetical protein